MHRDDEQEAPHLFVCMTREEFKLIFAVAFIASADMFEGAYDTERYASEGAMGDNWIELFKRAIRYLVYDCGAEFQGLEPVDDGAIYVEPVEERNEAYVYLLGMGKLPNVEDAMRVALEMTPHRAPKLDTEPLREALATIARQKESLRKQMNPEAVRAVMELRNRTLAGSGEGDVN